MLLNQNLHQTGTRFKCADFSMYACRFSVPQMRQFCLFTYAPRSKRASSEKTIFFTKIGIFRMSFDDPLSENALDGQLASTPESIGLWCMASYQGLYAKFTLLMSPKCSIVEDDGELMLMALHAHFLLQQHILECTLCFWIFTLWFTDEDAGFFRKITNVRS